MPRNPVPGSRSVFGSPRLLLRAQWMPDPGGRVFPGDGAQMHEVSAGHQEKEGKREREREREREGEAF